MVKGVNKQIIEVVNTENDCFEKAILFLRPEKIELSRQEKIREADRYVRRILKGQTEISKKAPRIAVTVLKLGGAAAAGAAAAALFFR